MWLRSVWSQSRHFCLCMIFLTCEFWWWMMVNGCSDHVLHSAHFEVAIWHKPVLLHSSANSVPMPTQKPETARCCETCPGFIWFLSGCKWFFVHFLFFIVCFLCVSQEKCGAVAGPSEWDEELAAWRLFHNLDQSCVGRGGGRAFTKRRHSRHHPILFITLVRSCAQVFLPEKIRLSEHGQGTCFSTCGIYVPWFDVFLVFWFCWHLFLHFLLHIITTYCNISQGQLMDSLGSGWAKSPGRRPFGVWLHISDPYRCITL